MYIFESCLVTVPKIFFEYFCWIRVRSCRTHGLCTDFVHCKPMRDVEEWLCHIDYIHKDKPDALAVSPQPIIADKPIRSNVKNIRFHNSIPTSFVARLVCAGNNLIHVWYEMEDQRSMAYCRVCFEGILLYPMSALSCGHSFHQHCVVALARKRYVYLKIHFNMDIICQCERNDNNITIEYGVKRQFQWNLHVEKLAQLS